MQAEDSLGNFRKKAEELLGSQYILADRKISALLAAVAQSRVLCDLMEVLLAKFDYERMKNKYFAVEARPDGEYRGRFIPPESDREFLPLVFRVLLDIDEKKIVLSEFLGSYFYENGSYAEGYAAFLGRMVRPFAARALALASRAVSIAKNGAPAPAASAPVSDAAAMSAPAEKPVENAPAVNAPVEKPVEKPVERPAEKPAESVGGKPNVARGDEPRAERTKKQKVVYRGKVVTLRADEVILPSGETAKREVVEHVGGAGVVAVNGSGEVLLVRQYRYAYGEAMYEIPAGKLDEGESPADAARRELAEETGVRAGELRPFGTVYPSCGYSNEKIFLFLTENFALGPASPDEDEELLTVWMPLPEAEERIRSGEIKDAKTVIGIQRYLLEKGIL